MTDLEANLWFSFSIVIICDLHGLGPGTLTRGCEGLKERLAQRQTYGKVRTLTLHNTDPQGDY